MGIANGIIIAKVPQELPVEKDTHIPNRKINPGINSVLKLAFRRISIINSAVPRALIMVPRDQASTSVMATSVMPFIPST